MRRKYIRARKDRAPEIPPPDPIRLWQLHTEAGDPLNIFHRQRGPFRGPPESIEVVKGAYSLQPYWGGRHRAVVKAGMVWELVKEYTPDHRPYPLGKLSKTPPPNEHTPHGKDKRWKMEYTRRAKVYRARQLGFEYRPDRKGLQAEREDEGIEFTWADWKDGHAEEALDVLERLWPKKARGIAHRLERKGVRMELEEG